jgi:Protein of unknown function (DUF1588)/Protein of unknown function (DUF1592)/Protein of unknown function (DUF1587)
MTLLVVAALGACQGDVSNLGGKTGETPGAGGGNAPPRAMPTPGTVALPLSGAPMRLLTQDEYQNSMAALLGLNRESVGPLSSFSLQSYGFSSIGAAASTLSEANIETAFDNATRAAGLVFADPIKRGALVGCEPTSLDDTCVTDYLRRTARLAFRGKDTPALVDEARNIGKQTVPANLWKGIEWATVALLASPHFLFRTEMGTPVAGNTTERKFQGVEMASRLAFALTQTTPSAALLDAAETGALDSKEGLEAQARLLLKQGASVASAQAFFGENMRLDKLDSLTKDKDVFPDFGTPLKESMKREVRSVVTEAVTQKQDLRKLYALEETHVDASLGKLYGMTGLGASFEKRKHTQDGRRGILGTAAFLSVQASYNTTSPTHRGKFVLENVLCEKVNPVPLNVDNVIKPVMNGEKKTLRQRLAAHVEQPQCAGCHLAMDGIGFGFEGFDALGRVQTQDQGFPVDSSASLEGVAFSNPAQLGKLLEASPQAASCLVERTYRQLVGTADKNLTREGFGGMTSSLSAQGFDWESLVLSVVTSDGFRYASAL